MMICVMLVIMPGCMGYKRGNAGSRDAKAAKIQKAEDQEIQEEIEALRIRPGEKYDDWAILRRYYGLCSYSTAEWSPGE